MKSKLSYLLKLASIALIACFALTVGSNPLLATTPWGSTSDGGCLNLSSLPQDKNVLIKLTAVGRVLEDQHQNSGETYYDFNIEILGFSCTHIPVLIEGPTHITATFELLGFWDGTSFHLKEIGMGRSGYIDGEEIWEGFTGLPIVGAGSLDSEYTSDITEHNYQYLITYNDENLPQHEDITFQGTNVTVSVQEVDMELVGGIDAEPIESVNQLRVTGESFLPPVKILGNSDDTKYFGDIHPDRGDGYGSSYQYAYPFGFQYKIDGITDWTSSPIIITESVLSGNYSVTIRRLRTFKTLPSETSITLTVVNDP